MFNFNVLKIQYIVFLIYLLYYTILVLSYSNSSSSTKYYYYYNVMYYDYIKKIMFIVYIAFFFNLNLCTLLFTMYIVYTSFDISQLLPWLS